MAALVMLGARYGVLLFDDDDRLARERVLRRAMFSAKGVLPATPDLARLDQRLAESGMQSGAPVLLRIFKQEFELEVWLRKGQRFEKFATYPICNFSGALGPKLQEGDRQSPEGLYTVDATALNPNSRWHKSFNLGFPNALDRAHQRTGSYLMVHGGCSSIGCYAMTDAVIDEIWRLVTAALRAGQPRFQVQVYPFHMTDAALAAKRNSPWIEFWRDLKQGNDAFLASGQPPVVAVCQGRYVVLNTSQAARRSETRQVAHGCPAS
jgi:murein L,D-transpeptidase YafK